MSQEKQEDQSPVLENSLDSSSTSVASIITTTESISSQAVSQNSHIIPTKTTDLMEQSFIDYAMSVIVDRALPDVRDGLKPVHRRILYAMFESGNMPNKPYKKSARMVGDVIGKYHPHGDSSVYGAAVRMAQSFSLLQPLIDGQGNFGSIDGDAAAAMRYTEMRLSKLAAEMFQDLRKDTIPWDQNYDGQESMPSVLTAPFPNLLVNGVDGIAVGMASSIPPHNLVAVCHAAIEMIERAGGMTEVDFAKIVGAPDFPTGGLVYSMDGFYEAVASGTGRMRLRAQHVIEERARGASRLVITELPYQVNKANLVIKIAELHRLKEIDGLVEMRDESSKEGIRIVMDIRADTDAESLFAILCKKTELETSINYNATVLKDGKPTRIGLMSILENWLSFRQEVVRLRHEYELRVLQKRLHILGAYIAALSKLDEVITLIRASNEPAQAKSGLMDILPIDEIQSQAILDLRLQKLTGMQINEIHEDYDQCVTESLHLIEIINSPELILSIIKDELMAIQGRYPQVRNTEIGHNISSITNEDMIERQDIVVMITRGGYVKRMPAAALERQNRGTKGRRSISIGDGDEVSAIYSAHSHDMLMVFAESGQVYGIKGYQIPEANMTSKGRHIKNVIEGLDEEIASIINIPEWTEESEARGQSVIVVTTDGIVKRSSSRLYQNMTRKGGVKGVELRDGNKIVGSFFAESNDHLILVSDEGLAARFDVNELRESGRSSMGVRGINLGDGAQVVGAYVARGDGTPLPVHQVLRLRDGVEVMVDEPNTESLDKDRYLLCLGANGVGKRTPLSEFPMRGRSARGVIALKINNKTGPLIGAAGVEISQDLIMFSSSGKSNRVAIQDIRESGRNTAGVYLMNVDKGESVISLTLTLHEDEVNQEVAPDKLKVDSLPISTEVVGAVEMAGIDVVVADIPDDE